MLFDGEAYQGGPRGLVPTPTILDNLIARGKIPPTVAVFVYSGRTRRRDLQASPPFAKFVATELLPGVREEYAVTTDPSRTVLAGSSFGGLASAHIAFLHPDLFGKVLAQSASFYWYPDLDTKEPDYSVVTGWLIRQYATSSRMPLELYLEVGRFDTRYLHDHLAANRHMRDVLEAKGYPVTYSEFDGGHDFASWRGTLADGLMVLLGGDTGTPE